MPFNNNSGDGHSAHWPMLLIPRLPLPLLLPPLLLHTATTTAITNTTTTTTMATTTRERRYTHYATTNTSRCSTKPARLKTEPTARLLATFIEQSRPGNVLFVPSTGRYKSLKTIKTADPLKRQTAPASLRTSDSSSPDSSSLP